MLGKYFYEFILLLQNIFLHLMILKYYRWHCKECGYLSVNRNALLKHFTKHHNGERPNHEPLSSDDDIEEWVI